MQLRSGFFDLARKLDHGWWEVTWTITWHSDTNALQVAREFKLPVPPAEYTDLRCVCALLPTDDKALTLQLLSRAERLEVGELVYAALIMVEIRSIVGPLMIDGLVRHPLPHIVDPLPAWVHELAGDET